MIDRFLEYISIERRYSSLTVSAYKQDLSDLCKFLDVEQDRFDPLLLTSDDISSFLKKRMKEDGVSARSACRYLSTFRSFWKFLLRIGYVNIDITARIVVPKINKPLPKFFKEDEMQRATEREDYDDDFVSVRDTLIIEILYQTGMRRAEIVGLKCSDVDFSLKQIKVLGKRNKERFIPISDNLLNQISRYLDYRKELLKSDDDKGELLLNKQGRALNCDAVYQIVRKRMREVTTREKVSPHVIRHTFATTMLNNGADINSIKTIMGHASLAATQIYTHTNIEQLKKEYTKAHPRAKGK